MAFREIGRGREAMETFTSVMNMPPPIQNTSFNIIVDSLHQSYETISNQSKYNVAKEVRKCIKEDVLKDDIIDCSFSIDGTWQKRGYSSLNDEVVVACINRNLTYQLQFLSRYLCDCLQ